MSRAEELKQEIEGFENQIAQLRSIMNSGNEASIRRMITSNSAAIASLREQLAAATGSSHGLKLSYRMFSEDFLNLNAATFSTSILGLQRSITLIYEALHNGPRSGFNSSKASQSATALVPCRFFEGSLGIEFEAPEASLLAKDDFEETLDKLKTVTECMDSGHLFDLSKELGKAPILAVKDWAMSLRNDELGIEMNLLEGSMVTPILFVQYQEFANLVRVIDETSDMDEVFIEVSGILDGIRSGQRFWLQADDGQEYSGKVAEDIKQLTSDLRHRATLKVETEKNYSTGVIKERYTLVKIEQLS